MTKYIENVNTYLSQLKIKQTFLSLKTNIEPSKLSRILTGVQDVSATDMEKIASALGKKTTFFLEDQFVLPQQELIDTADIVFYAGEPSKEQEQFAMEIIDLIENADEILGAKNRYMMSIGE